MKYLCFCPKRERSKYFKMNRFTKRFIFFKELFMKFFHMSMFPAYCFCQKIFTYLLVLCFFLGYDTRPYE